MYYHVRKRAQNSQACLTVCSFNCALSLLSGFKRPCAYHAYSAMRTNVDPTSKWQVTSMLIIATYIGLLSLKTIPSELIMKSEILKHFLFGWNVLVRYLNVYVSIYAVMRTIDVHKWVQALAKKPKRRKN